MGHFEDIYRSISRTSIGQPGCIPLVVGVGRVAQNLFVRCDLRNGRRVPQLLREYEPTYVFHLGAQASLEFILRFTQLANIRQASRRTLRLAGLLPTRTESNSQLILCRMSALLWAVFIFYLSTATFAQGTSQSRLTGAVALLDVTLSRAAFDTVHEVSRKLAHRTEYGIFGLLLYRSPPTPGGGERQRALWSVLAAAAYALTDESHQLFVPGRHASIADCALDSTGAALAVLLVLGYRSYREEKAGGLDIQ